MSEASRDFLNRKGVLPRLPSFKQVKNQTFRIVSDEIIQVKNDPSKVNAGGPEKIDAIKFIVECPIGGGQFEQKAWITTSPGVVDQVTQHKFGTLLNVELKSKKDPNSNQWTNYYVVIAVNPDSIAKVKPVEEEPPIIDLDEEVPPF